jgi:exopolysaccharide biosynthesis polyprenyl glycosylphosphotransferase
LIWKSHYHSRLAQVADFVTAFLAFITAYSVYRYLHLKYPNLIHGTFKFDEFYLVIILFLSYSLVLLFKEYKAYSYQRFTSLITEYIIIFKVTLLNFLISVVLIYMIKGGIVPRTYFALSLITGFFFLVIQKTFLFYIASLFRKKGKNRKRIIVVGTGERAESFINTVKENFGWGLDIIGLVTGEQKKVGTDVRGIHVLDIYDNIEEVLKKYNPEEVIITLSTKRFNKIKDVIEVCEKEGVQVRINSDFFGFLRKNVSVDNVFGLNIISFHTINQSEFGFMVKRLLDLAGASFALIIFSPFMLIAAIGIWISDGRPILYNWNVVGYNKKPFTSWKFRTMIRNADALKGELTKQNEMDGPVFKIKDDPRILPFGRWLRKWSIDETPQLLSVIKGDMGLVGPRPAGPHEFEHYQSWHKRKLSVRPGITCLWQINGRNKINKFDDWVKLDLEYIDNWSIFLDIKILLKTIPAVIFGHGAS